jgi:hypothetical protein
MVAREHGKINVAHVIPFPTACSPPQFEDFKLLPGCRLQADDDCRWEMVCPGRNQAAGG